MSTIGSLYVKFEESLNEHTRRREALAAAEVAAQRADVAVTDAMSELRDTLAGRPHPLRLVIVNKVDKGDFVVVIPDPGHPDGFQVEVFSSSEVEVVAIPPPPANIPGTPTGWVPRPTGVATRLR